MEEVLHLEKSRGSARLGSARLDSARLGSARLGSARLGSARLGSARGTSQDDALQISCSKEASFFQTLQKRTGMRENGPTKNSMNSRIFETVYSSSTHILH